MSRTATAVSAETVARLRGAFIELLGAERRLRSRDKAGPDGLTLGHLRAVMVLAKKGEATAGELARAADVNPATMTAMLDHLEEAEVVRRERSTEDRRVVTVALTAKGRRVAKARHRMWDQVWTEHLEGVSESDIEAAMRVLERITDLFETVARRES